MRITATICLLIFFSVSSFSQAKKLIQNNNTRPFVLGLIDEIESKELGEKRTVNIYLPEGYQKNDTIKYPVVYLLDGSADEDFIHVVGLYQYNSFPWIDRVPRSIVVGIANVDRRRDFTFPSTIATDKKMSPSSGHSTKFISFIEGELQPFVERNYHASSTSKTLIGESLGGLLATEILLKKPTLFDKYVIISPSLWWNDGSILKQDFLALKDILPGKIEVYIGVGKEGITPAPTPGVMVVDANVLADKLQLLHNKDLEVSFDYLPQEDHATVTHQAIFNALRMLYPAKNAAK